MAQPQLYDILWAWIPKYDVLMRLMLSHKQLSIIDEAVAENDWSPKPAVAEEAISIIWECFRQRLQTFACGSTPYVDICQRLAWVPKLPYPKIEVPYTEKRREQTKDTRRLLANELYIDLKPISAAIRAIPDSVTGTLPSLQYYYFLPEPELWIEVEAAVAEIMLGDWIWPAVDAFNVLLERTGYHLVIRGQVTDPSCTSKKGSRVDHAVVLTKPNSPGFVDTIVVIIEEKRPGIVQADVWADYLGKFCGEWRAISYDDEWRSMMLLLFQVREYSESRKCNYVILADAIAFVAMRWKHWTATQQPGPQQPPAIPAGGRGSSPLSPVQRQRSSLDSGHSKSMSTDSSGSGSASRGRMSIDSTGTRSSGRMSIGGQTTGSNMSEARSSLDSQMDSIADSIRSMSLSDEGRPAGSPEGQDPFTHRHSTDEDEAPKPVPKDECDYQVFSATARNKATMCGILMWMIKEAVKELNLADLSIPGLIAPRRNM